MGYFRRKRVYTNRTLKAVRNEKAKWKLIFNLLMTKEKLTSDISQLSSFLCSSSASSSDAIDLTFNMENLKKYVAQYIELNAEIIESYFNILLKGKYSAA